MKSKGSKHKVTRKITAQGLRAINVTIQRGQGVPDEAIAARIGHTSGGRTIKKVYGGTPARWLTGKTSSFKPKGKPAWAVLFQRRKAKTAKTTE
jgi:hypothetical protein